MFSGQIFIASKCKQTMENMFFPLCCCIETARDIKIWFLFSFSNVVINPNHKFITKEKKKSKIKIYLLVSIRIKGGKNLPEMQKHFFFFGNTNLHIENIWLGLNCIQINDQVGFAKDKNTKKTHWSYSISAHVNLYFISCLLFLELIIFGKPFKKKNITRHFGLAHFFIHFFSCFLFF